MPVTATEIQSNWNSMNSTEKSRYEGNDMKVMQWIQDTSTTTINSANAAVKRMSLGPLQSFLLCLSLQWYVCTTNIH